jgi:hypothetical protein
MDRRNGRRSKMNPASELAAQRQRIGHVCPVCGASFVALKTARYCSNACRQRAKYQRGKSGAGRGAPAR